MKRYLIPKSEFKRIWELKTNETTRLNIIANMNRINTLTSVKVAGSGHLGSSLSAIDIATWLYYKELNTMKKGFDSEDRDIYFSSKGHDVPGLYAILYSLNVISETELLKLRKLNGLNGHPDISNKGMEANSGSLGMGISKGRGMAWAKNFKKNKGRVVVLTGDGEFQEGQNFEALQGGAQLPKGKLIVIMDHNKFQTDKNISNIVSLGDIENKLKSFGWNVFRCDGHNFEELNNCFRNIEKENLKHSIIITDTIKGKGISFMEPTKTMLNSSKLYPWHSGAPDEESYSRGIKELMSTINNELEKLDLNQIIIKQVGDKKLIKSEDLVGEQLTQADIERQKLVPIEYVVNAYGEALVKQGHKNLNFVVLDADLSADCRLRNFEKTFPDRFIEIGIAEQDMVSVAGGIARQKLLPIVNSFGSFLAARANEQIYNNSGELSKIIYVCHYAGLIPAGPGKSHQSIRDISLFCALHNFEILQPSNAIETEMVVDYAINHTSKNCMIRLPIGPSPRIIQLPNSYLLKTGFGVDLNEGTDAILIAYGPIMLNEAMLASEILKERSISLKVVNMPWLNCVDLNWLKSTIERFDNIYILEDHSPRGGLGEYLLSELVQSNLLSTKSFEIIGVKGLPACGTPKEVLNYHRMDGKSLAQRIENKL